MSCLNKKILAGLITGVTLCFIAGCSSSSTEEQMNAEEKNAQVSLKESALAEVLKEPDSYLNQDLGLQGVIQSVEVKKINDDLSLLMVNLTPVESVHLLNKPDPGMEKYRFIENLRQAEDIYNDARYKSLFVRLHMQEKMEQLGCELKIASEKLQALGYYFDGIGKMEVAAAIRTVAKGYQKLGDAYFSFKQTASLSSMVSEASADKVQIEKIDKFENALSVGGDLFLKFVEGMTSAKDTISNGVYSYGSRALSAQRPFEILTFSSMLNAEAWNKRKNQDEHGFNVTSSLAEGVKALGDGDKLINEGLRSLSTTLEKTAVKSRSMAAPTLRCAYYGFNGSHLNRCAQALKSMGRSPVEIAGSLLRTNLREEVDVVWFKASKLTIDGMTMSLAYGDESGTFKGAVDLYNWADDVKKESE